VTTRQPPNILIFVFDAVRAENLSVLGYDLPTTPNLQRLAEDDELAVYPHAVSAATWTLPSSTSLFTGVYPSTHRLVHDGDCLSSDYVTLAEMLARSGYRTAKITGQVPYVSDFTRLDRGFETSFEPEPSTLQKWWRSARKRKATASADPIRHEGVDLGLDFDAEIAMHARGGFKRKMQYWLTGFADAGARACFDELHRVWQQQPNQPLFSYMHLQETHAEYRPPHRYREIFVPKHLRGRNFSTINQRPNAHAAGLVDMSDEDFEILTGLYDGCICYLDEQVGRVLSLLKADRERYDNTLILITADHGDCIGRHGVLGHQFVCYDELIRIPWLIKWPASVGLSGSIDRLVQNVDLVPTLCELIGLDVPEQVQSQSFLDGDEREVAYSELLKPFGASAVKQGLHEKTPHFQRAVLSARSKTHKLITYSNDQPDELFDLVNDPREALNLLTDGALDVPVEPVHQALRTSLEKIQPRWAEAAADVEQRVFSGDAVEIDPEIETRLKALGYLD